MRGLGPQSGTALLSGLLVLLIGLGSARPVGGGAYVFAGEANGVDLIAHPNGYSGTGGTVTVKVCIKPGTPNEASMVVPTQNIINTWNRLSGATGNLEIPSADLSNSEYDWESVAVHEVGHCIGLAHPNLASESGVGDPAANSTKASDGNGAGSDNQTAEFDTDAGTDGIFGSNTSVSNTGPV